MRRAEGSDPRLIAVERREIVRPALLEKLTYFVHRFTSLLCFNRRRTIDGIYGRLYHINHKDSIFFYAIRNIPSDFSGLTGGASQMRGVFRLAVSVNITEMCPIFSANH